MNYFVDAAFGAIAVACFCVGELRAAAAWMDRERRKRARR